MARGRTYPRKHSPRRPARQGTFEACAGAPQQPAAPTHRTFRRREAAAKMEICCESWNPAAKNMRQQACGRQIMVTARAGVRSDFNFCTAYQFAEFSEAAGCTLDAEGGFRVQQINSVRPGVRTLLFNFGDNCSNASARIGASVT